LRVLTIKNIISNLKTINISEIPVNKRTKVLIPRRINGKINPEYMKNYYLIHKKELRDYIRNNMLGSSKFNNGKRIKCNKRSYPLDNKCELCGEITNRLIYHHWNNEHLEFGLWLCSTWKCHWLAENIDSDNFEQRKNKYLNLKEIIEKIQYAKPYSAVSSSTTFEGTDY
jgi:hypothetical protein